MVDGNDGSYIYIPPGALQSTVTITMTPASNGSMPGGGVSGGGAVVFGPEGLQFNVPITVDIIFENLPAGVSPTDLTLFTAPAGADGYAYQLQTTVDGSAHLTAKTNHFSEIYVGRINTTGAQGGSGGAMCVSFSTPSKCPVCECADGGACPNNDRFQCACENGGTTCPGDLACCGNSCVPTSSDPASTCAQCANGLPSCPGSVDAGAGGGGGGDGGGSVDAGADGGGGGDGGGSVDAGAGGGGDGGGMPNAHDPCGFGPQYEGASDDQTTCRWIADWINQTCGTNTTPVMPSYVPLALQNFPRDQDAAWADGDQTFTFEVASCTIKQTGDYFGITATYSLLNHTCTGISAGYTGPPSYGDVKCPVTCNSFKPTAECSAGP